MLSCFNTFVDFKLIFTMLSGDAAARDAWLNSFLMLLFVALGLAVVALALILFVRRLFNKHHEYAHYAVLGFLITSAILMIKQRAEFILRIRAQLHAAYLHCAACRRILYCVLYR